MHEDLLGYLLGALEPHEMRRVAQWLRDDPVAREQLDEIERSLKALEGSSEGFEPPPADLVSRTLANLPPLPQPGESPSGVNAAEPQASLELASMHHAVDPPRDFAISWFDWIGGIAAAVVILGLLLPSIAEGRFESRKAACHDNLRRLGVDIVQFVNRNYAERLPAVSESGPEAFAGVFAHRLNDKGLMSDSSVRWCPSLETPSPNEITLASLNALVPVEDLHRVSVDQLRQMQQVAGGHYAYNLGVIERGRLASPRFEARSSFAVMSDAPQSGLGAENQFKFIGHEGVGINVLFEDGRIQFFPLSALESMPDHIWRNHRGSLEAGVNVDDASLAPSPRPPFVTVLQR